MRRDALEKFATATGIPVAVTQAGKGAILDAHPVVPGRASASPARPRPTRSRSKPTSYLSRHAAERLHDRLEDAVSKPARPLHRRSTFTPPTRASTARSRSSAMRGRFSGSSRRALAGWRVSPVIVAASSARAKPGTPSRATLVGTEARRDPDAGPGHRRSESRVRHRWHDGAFSRRTAGRPPQALALARRERLSLRIRLLVHGLRNRRRARREARATRTARSTRSSATAAI